MLIFSRLLIIVKSINSFQFFDFAKETRKNDSSAYLDQPKSKRCNDELTSLDQSQKAGCELSSLGIGTLAISGQEKQPTLSGSNTRKSASHRTSASRLALKGLETSSAPFL